MKKIEGIEISKKEPDFFGIKWVIRARDRKTKMLPLNSLLFQDGFWVATDGHRIHIYDTDMPYEEGLYKVLVNNIGQLVLQKIISDADYPNWQHLLTKKTYPAGFTLNSVIPAIAYTQIIRELPVSLTIDFTYLQDLLKNTDIQWTVQIDQARDGIIFIGHNKIGIIMPMSM